MSKLGLKKQLIEKIHALKTSAIPPVWDSNNIQDTIDDYISIFDDLFDNGTNNECYVNYLNAKSRKADVDFYLKALVILINQIKKSKFDPDIQGILFSKIADNFSINLLKQFAKHELNYNAYKLIIQNSRPERYENTVEVKTWGTKHEVSNGLRNVIQQQIQGESVGHASVTMRLKADAHGRELVNRYCLNKDGSVKIPYELKTYGQTRVYEIYWSFWPGGLQTLDNDIKTEHSITEHHDDLDILSNMPLELKSKYLFKKYVKTIHGPVIDSLIPDEKKTIFESTVQGFRIMGLSPVASFDTTTIEYDSARSQYLHLKMQQHLLDDEISSLRLLQENYLQDKKPFHPPSLIDQTEIKKSSNFLVLLQRFQPQLSDETNVAHIRLNRSIDKKSAQQLDTAIHNLMIKKNNDLSSLSKQINAAAKLIDEHSETTYLLKSEIAELTAYIQYTKKTLNAVKLTDELIQNIKTRGNVQHLTDQDITHLQNINVYFEGRDFIEKIAQVIKNKTLTVEEARHLEVILDTCRPLLDTDKTTHCAELSKKTAELTTLYSTTFEDRIKCNDQQLKNIDELILKNNAERAQWLETSKNARHYLELKRQIDETEQAHIAASDLIASMIEETPATSSTKKDKKSSQTLPKTDPNDPFDNAIKLRDQLYETLMRLKSEQKGLDPAAKKNKQWKPHFKFHNEKKAFVEQPIMSLEALQTIETKLAQCSQLFSEEKSKLLAQRVRIKVGLNSSIDDLAEHKIKRGASNDVLLHDFDIEAMLKKASELESLKENFHLNDENCSTTSMKLLNAGAPEHQKSMFEWHHTTKEEPIASNMFLTNPQVVYSSAKIVSCAENGEHWAKDFIQIKKTSAPNTGYNTLLNQLASSMTTYNNIHLNIPGKATNTEDDKSKQFSWHFYFKFIPYLLKLYQDIFMIRSLPQEKKKDTFQMTLAREIKALHKQDYLYVSAPTAPLAIHRMLEILKGHHTKIPFFTADTLARVEQHLLTLQAKTSKSPEEEQAIQNYALIQAERDARIQSVEQGILRGAQIKVQLKKRAPVLDPIQWTLNERESSEALIKTFILRYQDIRNENPLSFLTSNFIMKLNKIKTPEDQLLEIQKQIQQYPESRTAQALKQCLLSDPILLPHWEKTLVLGRPLHSR